MHLSATRGLLGALALVGLLAITACASTPGSIEAVAPVADRDALARYDALVLETDAAPSAQCLPGDAERIGQLTKVKLEELAPTRFKTIRVVAAGKAAEALAAPHLGADLTITSYERGSAVARGMMAGFGQMRIAGGLTLREQPASRPLGSYNLEKVFAWGGIYGAMTDIEDIEIAFAEATARAILGEQ
jgi:hypothetical protein